MWIVGFAIYFGYGIRNSAEEALAKCDNYEDSCIIKEEAIQTEKEAFLHNTQNSTREDEDGFWGDRRVFLKRLFK